MKPPLLFLSHRIPYPPDKGDKIRAWHMLEHLARGHQIHLGCFADDPADLQYLPILRAVCADVHCVPIDKRRRKLAALLRLRPGVSLTELYFRHASLQRWVDATIRANAMRHAFIFSSAMAPYLLEHDALERTLDMVDVDSAKWAEYGERAGLPARFVWRREGATLLGLERRATARFERTLLVSEPECRRFAALAPEIVDRIDWVENGVDLDYFAPSHGFADPFPTPGPQLVFTGMMDYWPNIDAVTWFAREIVPALLQRHPDLRFTIVGGNPDRAVSGLAALPGVAVTGRVPDVRPYLAHATAAVAPLRIARGIQNKVLEAMAMGRPMIASPQAFEGLRMCPGRDLLVAEGVAGMVRAVDAVLAGEYAGLGDAGRRAVETGYGWSRSLRRLDVLMGIDEPAQDAARVLATPA